MHHLEIHTRRQLDEFLKSQQDPDFLTKWIKEDDERTEWERFRAMEEDLEQFRDMVDDEREFDDVELNSHAEKIRRQLSGPDLNELRRYFLERELEISEKELSRRQVRKLEEGREKRNSQEPRRIAVEFTANVNELTKAVKHLRPARAKGL